MAKLSMSNTDPSNPGRRPLWASLGAERGSVPSLLRARAHLSPTQVYLRWAGQSWTFSEMLAQTEQLAGFLQEIDLAGPDRRCGISRKLPRSALDLVWYTVGRRDLCAV